MGGCQGEARWLHYVSSAVIRGYAGEHGCNGWPTRVDSPTTHAMKSRFSYIFDICSGLIIPDTILGGTVATLT